MKGRLIGRPFFIGEGRLAMNNDALLGSQLASASQFLQLGQVNEAHVLLKRLHKAHPKHTDIILRLALVERQLKHWDQAIVLMKKAVSLAPHVTLYVEHLANMLLLSNEGRNLLQAISLYEQILKLNPEHPVIPHNLLTLALRMDVPAALTRSLPPVLERMPGAGERLPLAAACAIAAYVQGDMATCGRYVAPARAARASVHDADGKPIPSDRYYLYLYAEFLCGLLAFQRTHPDLYAPLPGAGALHLIGESHCLTPAHARVTQDGTTYRVQPHLIMGGKAYFFSLTEPNMWQYALEEIIRTVPKTEPVAVQFGELDCRPSEGIMTQYRRDPHYAMSAAIEELCGGYVKCVKLAQLRRAAPTLIVGVPAPSRAAMQDLQPGEEGVFLEMVRQFNGALARAAASQGLGFIHLYAHTVGEDGWAKDDVHIDQVHLKPSVTVAALAGASW